MKEHFEAQRLQFRLRSRNMSLFIFILLFTPYISPFSAFAVEINSRAAVVMEALTGRILYGKNANLKLAPASTTKLMTAMVTLDAMNPSDTAVISERAAAVSPVKAHFRAGERVTIETLLEAALIKSANDAAFALSEAAGGTEDRFVELMNQKAIALGMSDTRFVNSTGLPGEGQFITAYDLARMLRQALKYPLIKETISTKVSRISTEDGRAIFIKNSNKLLWVDEWMLGGKTGYTRKARHCFVCAGEQGNETVIVALLGVPSRERLWKEAEELLEKGFSIASGKEEPVMFFTRSDYKESVQLAAYRVKSSETSEATDKKIKKNSGNKNGRGKLGKRVKKHKPKMNAVAEDRGTSENKS